jgi:hypothetical protein
MRVPAKHAWPLFMNPAATAVGMVLSRSASSRMIVVRFAAQLQRDALTGLGPGAQDLLSDGGRTGERNLCDIGMRCQQVADRFAAPGQDVDDARRQACCVKSVNDDIGLDGAHLAGFHDRSAAGGESGRDLRADEACVAIPGRDESGDADRSHEDSRGAGFPFEIVGFENRRGVGERLHRVAGRGLGALLRGAILLHRSQHDILLPAFDFSMQSPEHVDAFAF